MALSAAQLADLVAKSKLYMGLDEDDASLSADGIAVFGSDVFTTATVQVTDTTVTIIDNVTGTTVFTLGNAANDTLTELTAAIDGTAGWTATLLGVGSVDSDLLIRLDVTSCIGQANEIVLTYVNDELLELLITNAWDSIETELGRDLLSTSYTELFDWPMASNTLILTHPDVSSVSMLGTDVDNGLKLKYTGAGTHARVEVTDTAVILTSRAGAVTTTTTTLFADQATTTLMASTINAVGGWSSSVVTDGPSAYLVRQGAAVTKDREVTLEAWTDYDDDYETDYGAGVVEFPVGAWSARRKVYVEYTAGLSSIPADIEQVVLSLVKEGWDARSKSAGVQSERLGDYAYTMASGSSVGGSTHSMSLANHSAILDRYRRVRP